MSDFVKDANHNLYFEKTFRLVCMLYIVFVATDRFRRALSQAESMGMIERTMLLLDNLKMASDQWKRTLVMVTLTFFIILYALR